MYQWVGKLPNMEASHVPEAKAILQIVSAVSAALGCVLAALLGGRFGRRPVYAGLCLLSLVSMVGFYQLNTEYGIAFLVSGGFLSLASAAFYGWLPLYLPELFRTSVRATGQGFGFNFGESSPPPGISRWRTCWLSSAAITRRHVPSSRVSILRG
jgi:MFS family permease